MDESEVMFGIGPLLVIHGKYRHPTDTYEAFLMILLPSGRGIAINWRPKFWIEIIRARVT